MRTIVLIFLALGLFCIGASGGSEPKRLPKVVLMGDSIRMGYAPIVAKKLQDQAIVVHPKYNGGDSANVLAKLADWAVAQQPDVIHFNSGIHDIKKDKKTGKYQVPPEQYEANLRKIVAALRKETKATIIFATTTPIIDNRAAKQRMNASYELLDASTVEYNQIAVRVMKELKVLVHDLRAVCGDAEERGKLITSDGVHFSQEGRTRLGNAVADFVAKHLSTKQ